MPKKGVQQEDVDRAADALLVEGVRPTVERVRLKIGSGSPNTVGPMLEAWFGRLGARVAGMPASGPGNGLPLAAQNAFRLMWETAMAEANTKAEAALESEREDLHRDRVALAEDRIALEASRAALEENVRLAQAQATTAREQLAQVVEARRAQDLLLEQARAHTAHIDQQLEQVRARLDEQARAHARERETAETRAAANERRHLQEIDAARTETAKVTTRLAAAQAAEEASRERQLELQEQLGDLHRRHAAATSDLAAALEKVTAVQRLQEGTEARLVDLQAALASERTRAADLRKQLLATAHPRRKVAAKTVTAKSSSMMRKR
jgi:chromosome segregation ATPase